MTTIQDKLQGSMVALVTPMHSNGDVDWQSLANLIDWQIEQGTDVLVSVGTTGESATLSMQEHADVIEASGGAYSCYRRHRRQQHCRSH